MAWARRLRRELGAAPIFGEQLAEFRYLLLHVGTADDGARLELLEPRSEGFLTRCLDARGEGPHHLTFVVPDLRTPVVRAGARSVRVRSSDRPGVTGMTLRGGPAGGIAIGPARLGAGPAKDVGFTL